MVQDNQLRGRHSHAAHRVMARQQKQPPVRSTAFAEFVDIFPMLADLAGIAVPPLCPQDSSGVELCTEGTSLRPVFEDSSAEVKRAAFSQFPHGSPARMGYSMVTRIAEDGAAGNPRRHAAGIGSLHEVRWPAGPHVPPGSLPPSSALYIPAGFKQKNSCS